jgi:hypothetical protein
MRRLMYDLWFHGVVTRVGIDGNVCRIVSRAPDRASRARIATDAIDRAAHPFFDDEATLESDWIFTGATTFQETGAIQLGKGSHRLRFSTYGSAFLALPAEDNCRHGSGIRWVEGGEGRFAGASGLMTSVFCLAEDLSIVEHHIGVLLVP